MNQAQPSQHEIPLVARLSRDVIVHDLAPDGAEVMTGSFTPVGRQVIIDVDAAFSFMGWARGALLLYVGQPDQAGSRLFDSGGKPLDGVDWYSVGSISGESVWANTTHRRLVLDVDPSKPVTWQIVCAIIGASATTAVAQPRNITITPDGTKAFVTSPAAGTVTPIVLGRPGFSYDQDRKPQDVAGEPVATDASPTHVSSDNAHVVVSNLDASRHHVSVLSATTHEVLRQVSIPDGAPLGSALTPDGRHAILGTANGNLVRIELSTGDTTVVELGGRIQGVGVSLDGASAFAADAEGGTVYRIGIRDLDVGAEIAVGDMPVVVGVAPDGKVWVLCRTASPAPGRLKGIDPGTDQVFVDHELPYPDPNDMAIVPVEGQSSDVVRTAWVVYEGGRYSEFAIGGEFVGITHSYHTASFQEEGDTASSIAVNDYGEIWVVQPDLDRVWKWPGGRLTIRADPGGRFPPVFFGEYCEVSVYGARRD